MKLSEQWLRQWINPDLAVSELAEQLTMLGLEVASVQPVAGTFDEVWTGKIVELEQHPNAKKLHCCTVDVGEDRLLHIVCGATNLEVGLRVAVAKVGATLPGDVVIEKTHIRGALSEGMICSSDELGLGEGHPKGIMELPSDTPLGRDLRDYLSLEDHVIDIELTPNRSDCLSVRGIARDVAAANGLSIQSQEIVPQAATLDEQFPVTLDASKSCFRYVGRVIRGISDRAETPVWLMERLRRSGIRVIHPVVDVLNYVMLELGQPMHAFDLEQLDHTLVIRQAKKGECMRLLDGEEQLLSADTLIIADKKGPLAIAGVWGGLRASVTASTRHIFIESALFDPISIGESVRNYKLHTEASHRFERGVDYALQGDAIERATELLLQIVGGQAGPVVETISDAWDPPTERIVTLRSSEIRRLLGVDLADRTVENILIALKIDFRPAKAGWVLAIPSYRLDLEQEVHVVSEIARLYGYDRIDADAKEDSAENQNQHSEGLASPPAMLMPASRPEALLLPRDIATFWVSRGYHEAITYSFVSDTMQTTFDPDADVFRLSNPIADDMAVMRSSLWPGLIQATQRNQHRQCLRVRLFEIGMVFSPETAEQEQTQQLGIVAAGLADPIQWATEQRSVDFYDLKGDVEAMLRQTGRAQDFSWEKGQHPALHPGQTAELRLEGEPVGYLGVLHPKWVEAFELSPPVICFKVSLSAIQRAKLPQFVPISKFPAVRRDIAIMVDCSIPAAPILASVTSHSGPLLSDAKVFDVYQGSSVQAGQKSIGLTLTFQDASRTLQDIEIDAIVQDVLRLLKRDFDAELRKS